MDGFRFFGMSGRQYGKGKKTKALSRNGDTIKPKEIFRSFLSHIHTGGGEAMEKANKQSHSHKMETQ